MPVKLEHSVGVAAPAEVIWEILSDIPAWPRWNPIHPKADGRVGFGERLSLTLALPGEAHREIAPAVFDWTPNEAIHWRHSAVYGLVTMTRYLEIEKLSETGCAFHNGEIFGGLLGVRVARARRSSLKRGFAAVGEALKTQAEALWRERRETAAG
jgi:hypothetical protein